MKNFKIYLSGATKNVSQKYSDEWRLHALALIRNSYNIAGIRKEVEIFNPNKYFSYTEKKHKTERQIMDFELWNVKTSDLVIVNLDDCDKSIGTAMEIQYATDHNIPILGFGSKNIYPWIKEQCSVIFDSLEEVCDYVIEYYLI